MRLIDADELIKSIDYSADLGGALGKVVEVVKNYAKFMVQTAPTIKEQKTGKWVYNIHDIPICDRCGYMTPYVRAIDDYEYGNYCPNCGAKNGR